MYEHTTTELAEYLGTSRNVLYYHMNNGNLKTKYKAKKNDIARYYISHKEYLRFSSWFKSTNKYKNCGVAYKKTPKIDEYDLEPNKYNSYVALKIQRNKAILESKYLSRMEYKDIALYFNLKIGSIQSIIVKNVETDYTKQLKKMRDIFK